MTSRDAFPAAGLRKSSPGRGSARQDHFMHTLHTLAEDTGSDTIPVFVRFEGKRRRMDRGCIGHAVAAGLIEPPVDGAGGFVEFVTLRRVSGRLAT
ncbi:hypothetical protein O6X71_00175 [Sphingomonas faeni]